MPEKGRTHTLQEGNGVSSGFNCDNREGRTRCESKMGMALVLDLNAI